MLNRYVKLLFLLSTLVAPFSAIAQKCHLQESNISIGKNDTNEVFQHINHFLEDTGRILTQALLIQTSGNINSFSMKLVELKEIDKQFADKDTLITIQDHVGELILKNHKSLRLIGESLLIDDNPKFHPFFLFFAVKVAGTKLFSIYSFDNDLNCLDINSGSYVEDLLELYRVMKTVKDQTVRK